MKKINTEEEALATSNKFIDMDGLIGYFHNLEAVNFLLGTGKYLFWQAGWMGYVLKRKGT